MEQLTVCIWVDKAAAMAAGKVQWGATEIPVTEEQLLGLSPDAREVLAKYTRECHRALGDQYSNVILSSPVWEDVAAGLEQAGRLAVVELEKKREEQKKQLERYEQLYQELTELPSEEHAVRVYDYYEIHPLYSQVRLDADWAHAEDFAVLKAKAAELMREKNAELSAARKAVSEAARELAAEKETAITAFKAATVELYGSPTARDRYAAGLLPVEELNALVKRRVFHVLRERVLKCHLQLHHGFRITEDDVPHSDDCPSPKLTISTIVPTQCSSEHWELFQSVKQIVDGLQLDLVDLNPGSAPLKYRVELLIKYGYCHCNNCNADPEAHMPLVRVTASVHDAEWSTAYTTGLHIGTRDEI